MHILLLLIRPSLSIMLPAGVVNPNVSKAFEAFVNRPRAPCPLHEAWYTVIISSDLGPLKRWAGDLNPPPDVMVNILAHCPPPHPPPRYAIISAK